MHINRFISLCSFAACGLTAAFGQGTWTSFNAPAGFNPVTTQLLSDGSVIMGNDFNSAAWVRLTPNLATGLYNTGTFSNLPASPVWRLYYGQGLMPDGRVMMSGGEYVNLSAVWTNTTNIYDPFMNTWSTVAPPTALWGSTGIGDPPHGILEDGRYFQGNAFDNRTIFYQKSTNTWVAGPNKLDSGSEEGPIQAHDGTFVTPQGVNSPGAEKYNPATNTWIPAGTLPTPVFNSIREPGAGVSLPSGKIYQTGSLGRNVMYTLPALPSQPGTWAEVAPFPNVGATPIGAEDAMVSLLPNGKVLCIGGPRNAGSFAAPTYFFEYNPISNVMTQTATPSNNNNPPYTSRLLILPTGQILHTSGNNQINIYTPTTNVPDNAWRPTIAYAPRCVKPGSTFRLFGAQINGLSQGSHYGDEGVPNTNFPVVKLVNQSTGNIYWGRTHDFSTMSIKPGATIQHTLVDVASTTPTGTYSMFVIANGIGNLVPRTITITNTCTKIFGTVSLQDWLATRKGQPIFMELVNGATTLETDTVMIDQNGNYEFGVAQTAGTFSVYAKGTHWLRRLGSANLTSGSFPSFSLINGDCDNDNVVSIFDYIILSNAFDATPADANWDARADLDGDLVVSIFDYIILSNNFDKQGD